MPPAVLDRSLPIARRVVRVAVAVVLDTPDIARRSGAVLLASSSTANVGRGGGLAGRQIRVVQNGEPVRVGAFALTFVESRHSVPDAYPGVIDPPLVPLPRAVDDFGETMGRVLQRANAEHVELLVPAARQPPDPFAGLPDSSGAPPAHP